ncbi:hypothetical protein EJ03DRAFT_281362 [Teratosphaeria nubilosa]|uniref:Protein kinase domain-containing protein n=1 Tax=Teratosphaeria nubilosa TaxID=161662 RepID=A0A6G1KWM7_9PEZI|nr:hypothetical protein EJ03DRAFT_281362 [Teratosphaeria nubilosa]
MACIILLADGTRINSGDLVGSGSDGFVIRSGLHVLKAPRLFGYLNADGMVREDDDNWLNLGTLDVEKQVYQRLQKAPRIAECIESSPNGILLKYYPNRSLSDYIKQHTAPSDSLRWKWIMQATEALVYCHERKVIVFDIALRNYVLEEDLSLRMIDFANSALLPEGPDTDISKADVEGCTTALDIFHLSNVIYSILTWQDFRVDCACEDEWPTLDAMPDTRGLAHGHVIYKCRSKKFASSHDLQQELHSCPTPSTLPDTGAVA